MLLLLVLCAHSLRANRLRVNDLALAGNHLANKREIAADTKTAHFLIAPQRTTDATLTSINTSGSYTCEISNANGSASTESLCLTVIDNITRDSPSVTITRQPTDRIVCPKEQTMGSRFSIRATATGGTLSYQWQGFEDNAWVNLSDENFINWGSNTPDVEINRSIPYGYMVRCVLTATGNGASTTVYSNTAIVKGGVVPIITSNPKGPEYVCPGGSLTLSVTAMGEGLTYEWYGKAVGKNATSSTLTLSNIQPDQEGFYGCKVTGSCLTVWSNEYYLGVNQTPVITTQPPSTSAVKAGTSVAVSVGSNASWEQKYQWYKNGTTQAVAGATDATLTLANATSTDAGSYVCKISNQCGSVFSQPFVLSVTTPEPPSVTITSQPSNCVTCPKQGSFGASFSVRASATNGTLSYQWQALEGNSWTNLTEQQYVYEGTTTPNLTVIQSLSSGYTVRCVVTATGNGTSVTAYSNSAMTESYTVPTITSGPSGPDYVCEGSSLTLSVSATGQSLSYQWTKDNVAIPGATAPTLTLTGIKSSDMGYYVCTVNNLCAGFYSPGYYLSTAKFPTIRQQPPATKSICTTEALSLCVDTEGGNGFYTQWQTRSNAAAAWVDVDASIAGSSGDPYSGAQRCLSRLPFLTDGQQYRLKFYVPTCSDVLYSAITTLQSQSGIAITTQPTSSSAVCRGTNVSTTVVATGQNLTYQWFKGSTLVGGSTTATLKINNIQTGQAGVYTVKITNACGSVTSQPFTVSVTGSAPAISTLYASVTACEGSPLQVAKPVTSDANVTYQWLKGGQSIGAADNSGSLSFASVSVGDGGSYSVRVTNGCGSTTSTPFTLTVLSKAVITNQPLDAVVGCGSTSASFAVSATGQNLTYQWESRDNGTAAWQPISNTGVATAQLTVPLGLVGNGRQFRVGVSSATCPGMVYSNPATLTLKSPLAFTQQPTDFLICPAGTARFSISVNNNGGGAVILRWEYSDGNGWVTASGSGFSGNTTGNFYVSGTQLVNGRRFRAVAKVAACAAEVASNEAVLRVDAQYVPTLSGVTPDQTIRSGGTLQGISASASGGSGALKITWTRNTLSALNFNPALAQSGTSADFPVVRTVTSTTNSNQSLVFTLRVTDAVGCASTALSKVTIQPGVINTRLGMDAEESVAAPTLYPNPSSGRLLYVRGRQIKPETVVLYNLTGVAQPTISRLLDEERVEVKPQIPLEKGLYVLTLRQGDTVRHYRVVIE